MTARENGNTAMRQRFYMALLAAILAFIAFVPDYGAPASGAQERPFSATGSPPGWLSSSYEDGGERVCLYNRPAAWVRYERIPIEESCPQLLPH